MIVIYFLAALVATFAGSSWIDYLYRLPTAPLSFPEKIHGSNKFRKIFLTVTFFAAIIHCAEMSTIQAIYYLTAIFFLTLITVTDFEQYIIFDKMLLPFAGIGIIFSMLMKFSLTNHLTAAFIGGAIFYALMVVTKNGIGGGDVKLVAVLGLWLGIDGLSSFILSATVIAGVVVVILLLTKIKSRKDFFAYGPYFCISAAGYLLFDLKIL